MLTPASAPANAFIHQGLTTMRWGTDGFLQDADLQNGNAIVRSIKQTDRIDVIKEENNAGFEVDLTLIIQGQDYDITVTDNQAKSWPGGGSKIAIQGPDDAGVVQFAVIGRNYDAERKQLGTRTFKATCFSAFSIV